MPQPNRIYHTWDKWECFRCGFYGTKPPGKMTKDEAEETYRDLLSNTAEFGSILSKIVAEWEHSCEHYLTNSTMNRIAWMGQAALAYRHGVPASFRGGYHRLTEEQKVAADSCALEWINVWMSARGFDTYTLETIKSRTEANLY